MLSANPKPSHGSGISQEPVIFTLHCIFVETKAQSAHVFFPGASAFEEFQLAQSSFWALQVWGKVPQRRRSGALESRSDLRRFTLPLLSDPAAPLRSCEGVDSCFPLGSGWECVKFFHEWSLRRMLDQLWKRFSPAGATTQRLLATAATVDLSGHHWR